jgi:hypothetical protein
MKKILDWVNFRNQLKNFRNILQNIRNRMKNAGSSEFSFSNFLKFSALKAKLIE